MTEDEEEPHFDMARDTTFEIIYNWTVRFGAGSMHDSEGPPRTCFEREPVCSRGQTLGLG